MIRIPWLTSFLNEYPTTHIIKLYFYYTFAIRYNYVYYQKSLILLKSMAETKSIFIKIAIFINIVAEDGLIVAALKEFVKLKFYHSLCVKNVDVCSEAYVLMNCQRSQRTFKPARQAPLLTFSTWIISLPQPFPRS